MANKCSFDPSVYVDVPLGMFHCPECGEMVLTGVAHPDYSLIESAPNTVWSGLVESGRTLPAAANQSKGESPA